VVVDLARFDKDVRELVTGRVLQHRPDCAVVSDCWVLGVHILHLEMEDFASYEAYQRVYSCK